MSETREINYKINIDDAPVKSLKQELREATQEAQRLATAEVVDQAALAAAIKRTAELKDAMADVNEQVSVFASGSKYEQASNALGQVKDAIFSLDFEKAQERAVAFARAAKTINFGDAISSVQQLGSTFISIGRALLTNPIFLLAAVIAGIVYIVYKLLDSLGVVKVAMEALGKVVDAITDLFYSLTDALGLTSKAADDAAAATVNANDRMAESSQQRYDQMGSNLSNELRLMKASSDGSKESADAIIKKEQELLFVKRHSAKVQMNLAISTMNAMKSSSETSQEELDAQKKKVIELTNAFKTADTDAKEFDAKTKKDAADKKKKDDEETRKNNAAAAEKRKAAEEKRKAAEAQYAADRLNAARTARDLELSLMADGVDKELAINKEKFTRLIADTQANTKLNEDEKKRIIDFYQQTEKQTAEGIVAAKNKTEQDAEKAHQETLAALKAEYAQKAIDPMDFQARQELLQSEYDAELLALKASLDAKALSQEEYNARLLLADQEFNEQIKALGNERVATETEQAEQIAAAEAQLQQAKAAAFQGGLNLLGALFSKNEGIMKALFAVEQGKAAADVIVNGLKTNAILVGSLAKGIGTMSPAQVATAKAGIIINKIGMATALAGIAAATISKFKGGRKPPMPSDGGGGGSGGGGGGSTPQIQQQQPQQTPQINMWQNQPSQNQQTNIATVVDYTDIRKKEKNIRVLENAVSLGV